MKWVMQILVMLTDVICWTIMYMLATEGAYIIAALFCIAWFYNGGFVAWRPKTIKAFLINYDSYLETGKPKIREIK